MRRRAFLSGAAAISAAALAACSSEDGSSQIQHSEPPEETPEADTPADDAAPTEIPADRQAPTIEVPAGDPPTELKIEDEIVGGGAEATAGKAIDVHYVGVAWSTGKEFDQSWSRGEPLPFQLGAGQVIEGWDKGLEGMKVGSRRRITIPPQMGYGDQGAGPDIKPGETLIFVCDLVAVH